MGRPHTLIIIPMSSVLEFIVHKQWIMFLQVKCMEFYSPDGGSLHYHTHWSSMFIHSCWPLFEILLQTATQAQGSYCCTQDPTHCLHDRHLATAYKQKEIEGNNIPTMPGLLIKKWKCKQTLWVTERQGLSMMQ